MRLTHLLLATAIMGSLIYGNCYAAIQVTNNLTPGTTVDYGNVRVGTSKSATVNAFRTGPGNNNPTQQLSGTFPTTSGDFAFSGVQGFGPIVSNGASSGAQRTYTYTPSGFGSDTASLTVLGTNGHGNSALTLQGQGVGPQFADAQAYPGHDIDFGNVLLGVGGQLSLTIRNVAPFADLGSLTDLTLKSFSFTGDPVFALSGFTANTVLGTYGATSEQASLAVQLLGTAPVGPHSGVLTFVTDQGAAFGGNGQTFSYDITANVQAPVQPVPEPSSLLIFAGLSVGGCYFARRRAPKTTVA